MVRMHIAIQFLVGNGRPPNVETVETLIHFLSAVSPVEEILNLLGVREDGGYDDFMFSPGAEWPEGAFCRDAFYELWDDLEKRGELPRYVDIILGREPWPEFA